MLRTLTGSGLGCRQMTNACIKKLPLLTLDEYARLHSAACLLKSKCSDRCAQDSERGSNSSCKIVSSNPCNPATKSTKKKKCTGPQPKTASFMSMWEKPNRRSDEPPDSTFGASDECCPKCDIVRFDELYYKPSNKSRRFQRTWWECCPRMVPKRVCCWCDAAPPEVERREIPPPGPSKAKSCMNEKPTKCMRLAARCCRTGRVPPCCKKFPVRSDCTKCKCPFPSYSECIKKDPADLFERPPECHCIAEQSQCMRNRLEERIKRNNIKIYPCGR